MADFSKLQADVAAEGAAVTKAVALLNSLVAKIAALQVANPADQATIDALAAAAESDTAALVAGVTAATPPAA